MEETYSPVQWVYKEIIEEEISKKTVGKIFYFCKEEFICSPTGQILTMEEIQGQGIFIHLDNKDQIRIDRIITIFGKPGPAFDEYDAYANACLDCKGGYDLD